MDNKHRYKNTGDKQTTWFVIFFVFIALTIALIAGVIANVIKEGLFIPVFFISLVPLAVIFILLALYITSSKVKDKRGKKKLELVLDSFSKKYVLVKDVDQLDYVLITPYRIYGITIKSYEGYISGLDTEETWRQAIAFQKKKNALPNPVKECIELSSKLAKRIKEEVEPVVVLTSGNRGYIISNHLYSPNQLETLVNTSKAKYTDNDIVRIKEAL